MILCKALYIYGLFLDCSINFHQSVYVINENQRNAQVELALSNPVSFDFTVIINDLNGSAVGMYSSYKDHFTANVNIMT